MNITLWILQAILAFLYLSGGYFKAFKFGDLASQYRAIPPGGWRLLGVIEMSGAVLLVLPGAIGWMPQLTWIAAAILAIESLTLSAMFARHSVKVTAENPLIWNVVMGVLAALVAYGRYAVAPLG